MIDWKMLFIKLSIYVLIGHYDEARRLIESVASLPFEYVFGSEKDE